MWDASSRYGPLYVLTAVPRFFTRVATSESAP